MTLHGTGLSIADVDAGAAAVRATVSVTSGILTAAAGTTGVTVTGSGTASVTLDGTLTQINNLLAGSLSGTLTYTANSDTPAASDTLTLTASDLGNTGTGGTLTGSDTATINITAVNDAPINSVPGIQGTFEDTPLTFSSGTFNLISISDVDAGASSVQVTLTGTNGTVTLSGTAGLSFSVGDGTADSTMTFTGTIANINTALAGMNFAPTANFNGGASLQIVTNDQGNTGSGGALSDTDTVNITVNAVNDVPVRTAGTVNNLTVLEDSGFTSLGFGGLTYSPGGGADESGQTLTYQITILPNATTFGKVYLADGTTQVTLNSFYTLAEIRGLQFQPAADKTGTAGFAFNVADSGGTANGGLDYIQEFILITITPVNDAPVITTTAAPLAYTENDPATAIDPGLTVSDVDSTNLTGATVTISGNYANGQDVLGFTNQLGITGSWSAATGALTLSGTTTKANYQTALRSVTYVNSSDNPSALTRTISFVASDGTANSTAATRDISITPVNDASVLAAIEGTSLAYTENAAATAITATITASDLDNTNLAGATIQITGNYQNGQDVLSFTNTGSITGTWTAATGTLTLTGSDTVANYQAALRAVKYQNTSDNPSGLARTVSFTVNDGTANSNTVTRNIAVTPVNDPSVLAAIEGTALAYTENQAATAITSAVTVSDPDSTNLTGATVTISSNYVNGQDVLSFTNQLGITGTWTAATGTLTLSGTTTVANYQAALRAVKYANSSENPNTSTRTVSFTTTDGALSSNTVTRDIAVNAVNDAPTYIVGDGKLTTAIGASHDNGRSVTVQTDGKILVAGYSNNGGAWDFALVRYNSDGTLDTSFSGDGKLTTNILTSDDYGYSVTVQADGKILVAGASHNGSDWDIALVRYNSDGSLDPSFSGDGKLTTAIGTSHEVGYSVTVQADGKILVAGQSWNASDVDFALVRYNSDGTLDTSFSGDGKLTTAIGASDDYGYSVTVQADGKILVAGQSSNDFALVRYNSDGSLDPSFSGDGKLTTAIGAGNDFGYSVTVQADGKILVAGASHNGSNYDFALVRYNSDGTLDPSFSGDGKLTTVIGASDDYGWSVTVQADGKILVAGYSANGSNNDFALVRYNSDGTLDPSFSGDGKLTTAIGAGHDEGYSVTVQADGKILVAGYSSNGSNDDFALVRYNSDGTLDTSFDFANTLGGTVAFTEGGAAVVLDADVQVLDAELSAADNFNGATLSLARNGGANAQDLFSATGTLAALTQGGSLIVGGTTIGTVTTNSGGTLLLTLNSNATNTLVNSALQQIAYSNSSDAPPASVQINWTFNDGNAGAQGSGGPLTATGSVTVNITPVNDPSVLAAIEGTALAYTENQAATAITATVTASDRGQHQPGQRHDPDHRQLPERPGRAVLHQHGQHHRHLDRRHRNLDLERLGYRRQLPGRLASGEIPRHE